MTSVGHLSARGRSESARPCPARAARRSSTSAGASWRRAWPKRRHGIFFERAEGCASRRCRWQRLSRLRRRHRLPQCRPFGATRHAARTRAVGQIATRVLHDGALRTVCRACAQAVRIVPIAGPMKAALFNSGAEARRERRQDCARGHRPARRALRSILDFMVERFSRCRSRARCRRTGTDSGPSRPKCTGFRSRCASPATGTSVERRRAAVDRRAAPLSEEHRAARLDRLRDYRAGARRGRLHRAAAGVPGRSRRDLQGARHPSRSPTKCRPDSAGPAGCSRASASASSPISSAWRNRCRMASRFRRSSGVPRSWTRHNPADWAVRSAATRFVRRGSRRDRDHRAGRAVGSRRNHWRTVASHFEEWPPATPLSPKHAAWARCGRSSWSKRAPSHARSRSHGARPCARAARGPAPSFGGLYSNVIRTLMPLTITDAELEEGLTVLESCLRDTV